MCRSFLCLFFRRHVGFCFSCICAWFHWQQLKKETLRRPVFGGQMSFFFLSSSSCSSSRKKQKAADDNQLQRRHKHKTRKKRGDEADKRDDVLSSVCFIHRSECKWIWKVANKAKTCPLFFNRWGIRKMIPLYTLFFLKEMIKDGRPNKIARSLYVSRPKWRAFSKFRFKAISLSVCKWNENGLSCLVF